MRDDITVVVDVKPRRAAKGEVRRQRPEVRVQKSGVRNFGTLGVLGGYLL
jgi:hypothetical protein